MSTFIISRSVWEEQGYPVTGNDATPNEWSYNTLHWPGANVNVNDPIGTLRGMQRSWCNSKGYSLGYNFAIFPDGSAYEVRGFDIRCAANGDQSVNRPGVAILLTTPNVNTPPTSAMVEAAREVIRATRTQVPQSLIINGHCDVRPEPTQCPGEYIYNMITAGQFEPSGQPVPTPPSGDDDMAALGYYKDDRPDGQWQIWVVDIDAMGEVWTCPVNDLPDGGKWEYVQPIVGDPPTRPFTALAGLMDQQNRPGA